jgi:kynurenine formamidase
MRKFIDLSVPVEVCPSEPFMPIIHHHDHKAGSEVMCGMFGCRPDDLPEGLGWANDTLTVITHAGTHLDAPWHFFPRTEGRRAITIDEVPLDWCMGPGVVLDFRHKPEGSVISTAEMLEAEAKCGRNIRPMDIVMIMTGADKLWGAKEYFDAGCGMSREATLWLIDRGVKVMGIDAWGWDRPFKYMKEEFQRTGNGSRLWEAHFAGIEREYCHIEKLANLDQLPPHGFTVFCFPVKIKGGSAGWVRAVALMEN